MLEAACMDAGQWDAGDDMELLSFAFVCTVLILGAKNGRGIAAAAAADA